MQTGRTPCEHEGRDLGDVSTSQGTPKMARKPQEAERKTWSMSSSQPSEETNTANTLTLDFWPPEQ